MLYDSESMILEKTGIFKCRFLCLLRLKAAMCKLTPPLYFAFNRSFFARGSNLLLIQDNYHAKA